MSHIELYQSILLKLGQLPTASLSDVDIFLSELAQKGSIQDKKALNKIRLALVAGAWKDWDDQAFHLFLETTLQIRSEMFTDRLSTL